MDRRGGKRDKGETQTGGNLHRRLRSCAWSRDIDFHLQGSLIIIANFFNFTLCVSGDCPLSVLFCFRTVISFSFSSARPLCFPLSILLLRRSVHPRTKIIFWVQCLCGHRVLAHPASSTAIQLLLPTAVCCRWWLFKEIESLFRWSVLVWEWRCKWLMPGIAEWQVSLELGLAWERVWNVGMLHIWRLRWTRKLVYIDRCCCYDWWKQYKTL